MPISTQAESILRISKSTLRIIMFAATGVAAMALSITGAFVGMQGGNFWPWAIASFAIYAFEITFVSIAVIHHARQPEARRQRELKRQRKQRQAARTLS